MIVEVAQGPLEYLSLVPDSFSEVANYPLVVFLHGYGADMHDLAELGPTIDSTGYVYILPNGPQAAFVGMDPSMRAWFERGGEESPEGVALARERLQALLEVVWKRFGTPTGQTVLVGFSQGGNLALRHGLPAPQQFAGIASIAGSLRKVEDLTATLPPDRRQRLFLAHGYRDTTVPYTVGRLQADYLQRHGYRFELQSYTIGPFDNTPGFGGFTSMAHGHLPSQSSAQPGMKASEKVPLKLAESVVVHLILECGLEYSEEGGTPTADGILRGAFFLREAALLRGNQLLDTRQLSAYRLVDLPLEHPEPPCVRLFVVSQIVWHHPAFARHPQGGIPRRLFQSQAAAEVCCLELNRAFQQQQCPLELPPREVLEQPSTTWIRWQEEETRLQVLTDYVQDLGLPAPVGQDRSRAAWMEWWIATRLIMEPWQWQAIWTFLDRLPQYRIAELALNG